MMSRLKAHSRQSSVNKQSALFDDMCDKSLNTAALNPPATWFFSGPPYHDLVTDQMQGVIT